MKLPWKNETPADPGAASSSSADAAAQSADGTTATATRTTQGKGRPTPKRREAEARRRGPVTPAPQTRAEARARRKELKGPRKSRAERKVDNEARRTARIDQRQKMMDGDERYLMPRDKGPVRRYVRDIVDSRRNFAGLFMPFAILLIAVMLVPAIAVYSTLFMVVFVAFLVVDAVILGRMVTSRVRDRFPDSTDGGFALGWYAFTRSMQMRFMRAPRPQARPGDAV